MFWVPSSTGYLAVALNRFAVGDGFPCHQRPFFERKTATDAMGRWALLLSWMPIIGDPITVVAGVLRESFWVFLALVTAAKLGRYLVVVSLLP
jgi:membrane protein YqaA with SNARE-associated domain